MNRHVLAISAAALILGGAFGATSADAAAAIDLKTPGQEFDGATLVLGFQFSVDSNQTVKALGVYDAGRDGLLFDAPVGIWDAEGKLLASSVIHKDGGGQLDGFFRYEDITPLKLFAGQHYVVGALFTGDFASSLGLDQGGVGSINPHVRVEQDRFLGTGAFDYASQTEGGSGAWLGGTFKLADGVPEPASWVLMIAGFGLAGTTLRARRRSALGQP